MALASRLQVWMGPDWWSVRLGREP